MHVVTNTMQKRSNTNGPRRTAAAAQQGKQGSQKQTGQKQTYASVAKQSVGSNSKGVAAAYSTRTVSTQPRISTSSSGAQRSTRVVHRELVNASVAGSTSFAVQQTIALNPGLAASFPWLSVTAANWEQYKVHRLEAVYVPIAPTNTQGDIMLSPDYDASDPVPTTEVQAGNNAGTVQDSCWSTIRLRLDPQAMMGLGPRRFVRQSAVAGDVKTFDVGKLFVCSNNQTGTAAIGKLWLEYDIEFFVPQNSPNTDSIPLSTSFQHLATPMSLTTATAKGIQFDTIDDDPLSIGSPTLGAFTPPAGSYRVEAFVTVLDNSNEVLEFVLQLFKNGSVVATQLSLVAACSSGESAPVAIGAVINCNGTDTFTVKATATGAAGTLTVSNAQLLVSLA